MLATWAVTLLSVAGHGSAFAGVASALILLGGVVARPAGGWIGERGAIAAHHTITGALVASGAGAALLAAAPGRPGAALAGAALVGVAGALPFGPVFSKAVVEWPERPGMALAAVNLYPLVVIIGGVPLLGLSFSLPGDGRLGFAIASLMILPAHLAVGAAWGKGHKPLVPACR